MIDREVHRDLRRDTRRIATLRAMRERAKDRLEAIDAELADRIAHREQTVFDGKDIDGVTYKSMADIIGMTEDGMWKIILRNPKYQAAPEERIGGVTGELATEYVPLASLIPADRNPKAHEMPGIKASLRRFGLFDNVGQVDGRTSKLYGGHGRVQGLRDMHRAGEQAPTGVREAEADGAWWVPALVGWSSRDDAEAEAVLLAANQHVIAGGWERELRDQMLNDLHADDAAWTIDELGFPRWPDDDDEAEAEKKLPTLGWKVVVECESEEAQTAVLNELAAMGLSATAVFT